MYDFCLTDEQERIVSEAVHWFKYSSDQVFELCGEAGTGKSVVLWEIVKRLRLKEDQYMPMAYTGQAAIVMRTKGFPHAKSIHSSLYEYNEIITTDYGKDHFTQFNAPKKEIVFVLKPKERIPRSVQLFVIDEGYQVPMHMKRNIESFGIKCLVGGDDGQLPPVSGQPAYFTGDNVHRLTTLLRQEADSPIVYLAHRARRGLPIHCGMYGSNVLVIEDRDLSDELLSTADVIACGVNATRDALNTYIRNNIRHLHGDLPNYGERMICRNNNWSIECNGIALANGLVGTVVNQPYIDTFDGETFKLNFAPDLGGIVFRDLHVNYKYFKAPYQERKNMKLDKFNTGEKFEYAYALTTHLAQGAEYDGGIYIEDFLRPESQNQLNYTGITRFRKNLVYVKRSKRLY